MTNAMAHFDIGEVLRKDMPGALVSFRLNADMPLDEFTLEQIAGDLLPNPTEQQLIATVYGVVRIYTDFVALYEDEKVKEETVRSAEKLLSDTKAQVEEGTLAPVA